MINVNFSILKNNDLYHLIRDNKRFYTSRISRAATVKPSLVYVSSTSSSIRSFIKDFLLISNPPKGLFVLLLFSSFLVHYFGLHFVDTVFCQSVVVLDDSVSIESIESIASMECNYRVIEIVVPDPREGDDVWGLLVICICIVVYIHYYGWEPFE